MFPQGLLSQAYFMSALVGGGFLLVNFVMGHLDEGGHDAGHGGHDGHSGGHDGHGDAHGDGDHGHGDSDHGHGEDHDTNRYSLVTDHRLENRIGKLVLSLLSPMSIAIFLAFFGLTGYASGYMMPWLGFITLVPAVIAGFLMINIFKSAIQAMMKYGTSSSHMRNDEIIGHIAEVLVPIAENRPGEVTYIIQSKIYSSTARSKPGTAINKGTKVMIVERDGPTVFVEPYRDLLLEES
jgi:membrane protein implicated in regulation of membrane protease activity